MFNGELKRRVSALEEQLVLTTEITKGTAEMIAVLNMSLQKERGKNEMLTFACRSFLHAYGNGTTRGALFRQMGEYLESHLTAQPDEPVPDPMFCIGMRLVLNQLRTAPDRGGRAAQ